MLTNRHYYHLDHRDDDHNLNHDADHHLDHADDHHCDDDDYDQDPLDYPSVQGLDLAADCLVDCKPLIPPPAHQVSPLSSSCAKQKDKPILQSSMRNLLLQTGSLLWPELSHSKLGYGDLLSGRQATRSTSSL